MTVGLCLQCEAPLKQKAKFCAGCGLPIHLAAPSHKKMFLIAGFGISALLLASIFYTVLANRQIPRTAEQSVASGRNDTQSNSSQIDALKIVLRPHDPPTVMKFGKPIDLGFNPQECTFGAEIGQITREIEPILDRQADQLEEAHAAKWLSEDRPVKFSVGSLHLINVSHAYAWTQLDFASTLQELKAHIESLGYVVDSEGVLSRNGEKFELASIRAQNDPSNKIIKSALFCGISG